MTEHDVRIAVARYWDVVTNTRSVEDWIDLFAFDSVVFGTASIRTESGRLVATARAREYLGEQSTVAVELGPVQVTVFGNGFASACYICQFKAAKIQRGIGTVEKSEAITNGRMTQIFGINADKIQILHEHFSVPARPVS